MDCGLWSYRWLVSNTPAASAQGWKGWSRLLPPFRHPSSREARRSGGLVLKRPKRVFLWRRRRLNEVGASAIEGFDEPRRAAVASREHPLPPVTGGGEVNLAEPFHASGRRGSWLVIGPNRDQVLECIENPRLMHRSGHALLSVPEPPFLAPVPHLRVHHLSAVRYTAAYGSAGSDLERAVPKRVGSTCPFAMAATPVMANASAVLRLFLVAAPAPRLACPFLRSAAPAASWGPGPEAANRL